MNKIPKTILHFCVSFIVGLVVCILKFFMQILSCFAIGLMTGSVAITFPFFMLLTKGFLFIVKMGGCKNEINLDYSFSDTLISLVKSIPKPQSITNWLLNRGYDSPSWVNNTEDEYLIGNSLWLMIGAYGLIGGLVGFFIVSGSFEKATIATWEVVGGISGLFMIAGIMISLGVKVYRGDVKEVL